MLLFELYLILIILRVELDTTEFNNTGYDCFSAVKLQAARFPRLCWDSLARGVLLLRGAFLLPYINKTDIVAVAEFVEESAKDRK